MGFVSANSCDKGEYVMANGYFQNIVPQIGVGTGVSQISPQFGAISGRPITINREAVVSEYAKAAPNLAYLDRQRENLEREQSLANEQRKLANRSARNEEILGVVELGGRALALDPVKSRAKGFVRDIGSRIGLGSAAQSVAPSANGAFQGVWDMGMQEVAKKSAASAATSALGTGLAGTLGTIASVATPFAIAAPLLLNRDIRKGLSGMVKDVTHCIIITACTSPYAYEVEVSRAYRDIYMTPRQVRGYYVLAEKTVPVIGETAAKILKKIFVSPVVEYGEYKLNIRNSCSRISKIISLSFLGVCSLLGRVKKTFTRSNGEKY
jgi:hypothetical protein